eukprot:TRINITY_DN5717_c0_g1_i1.p1 TRINITY_DN5717_c0_g1~~TRINITY_DN5717_c0_g1_i1.p1  ORF type:complete len:330 (+),score=61.27 TRINITY_DN5717_c0_g1_i1:29-991(+)
MGFLKVALGCSSVAAAAVTIAAIKTEKGNNTSFPCVHPSSKVYSNSRKSIFREYLRSCSTVAYCSDMSLSGDIKSSTEKLRNEGAILPELLTEFMVDMKCGGCASTVRNKLETLDGVKKVDVDLENQVVRVLGSTSVRTLTTALEQTGMKTRLIGQGSPEDFLVSSAVAEFKGPKIYGVARFAQVNMELCRVEANFSGLSPGINSWCINEFGDLTNGAASTGKVYNAPVSHDLTEPLGDLGQLNADDHGEASFSGVKPMLKVVDLIGRAVVVYDGEDKSKPGVAAAVIARSAGVGENYKKVCTCDGTIIWESTNNDFVKG